MQDSDGLTSSAGRFRGDEAGPYKGAARSYEREDADLFFGRRGEVEGLVSRILSSDVTLLHARSGAGKTSLLNAGVIPGLERRGWAVVRTTFEDDPIQSVRAQIIATVLPPPAVERQAVLSACSSLGLDTGASLDTVLREYDDLGPADVRKRALTAPIELRNQDAAAFVPRSRSLSMFQRLLREAFEVDAYFDHLGAIAGGSHALAGESGAPQGTITVGRMLELLEQCEPAYATLIERLTAPEDQPAGFAGLLDRLFFLYGLGRQSFRLIIVLDQFEAIFTQFTDAGGVTRSTHTPAIRRPHRTALFAALEAAYRRSQSSDSGRDPLPVRFVLSIREDYLGPLDVVRRFVPDLDRNAYRLNLLRRGQAEQALQEPGRLFGFEYSPACVGRILGDLTGEEGFIEPGVLQMACSKLWTGRIRERVRVAGTMPLVVESDVFEAEVGGVEGIVEAFVEEALSGLPPTDRGEALDILQSLVTPDRTRDFLAETELLHAAYRFPRQREKLLAHLEARGIVHIESRLNRRFVEITHDLLIEAILRAYREHAAEDPGRQRFRRGALAALRRAATADSPQAAADALSKIEFMAVHEFRQSINFAWTAPGRADSLGAEMMLHAAIRHADDASVLAVWTDALDAADAATPVTHERAWGAMSRPTRLEWRRLCQSDAGIDLSPDEVETMLRATIEYARDDESDWVVAWTEKVVAHEQSV